MHFSAGLFILTVPNRVRSFASIDIGEAVWMKVLTFFWASSSRIIEVRAMMPVRIGSRACRLGSLHSLFNKNTVESRLEL